jgi:hypothetical protein
MDCFVAPLLAMTISVLLSGCGSGGGDSEGSADTNQIERLSRPKVEAPDPRASARLEPVTPADLEQEGLLGAGCSFTRDGRILIAVAGSDAIVRHAGELRHLVHSAPAGATGGFFEDRQLSVSVGRTSEQAVAADEGSSWPARMTVTNRRTEAQVEHRGVWTCGA